jgi:pyruvate,water dikinase
VCRELGIPCVLGTGTATTAIADGVAVTVDGDAGLVRIGS